MLLVFDQYSFDDCTKELRRGAALVKVDPQQLGLLALFLRHPGELLSRAQIIERIWDGRAVGHSVLSVSIAKLRKALGRTRDQRDYIESSYGRGYRFVHEVRALQPQRAANVQPPRGGRHAPLVGRAQTFGRLVHAAEQARAGRGKLCLITGDKGIGKTSLAYSLAEHVQGHGGMRVAWACFQHASSTPLEPVRQMLRELARQGLTTDLHDALDEKLARGTVVTHATLDALSQALLGASRREPLLLIFDNLRWTHSASLSVLRYLADALGRDRILIVATLRYEQQAADARSEVVRLWNHRNCQRLELGRLSALDVSEYVRAHFGEAALDTAELSRRLYERSEGHPFFMVELLRAVDLAQGKKLSLPSGMVAMMRERLRGLSADARHLLGIAALLGQSFDLGLLSIITARTAQDLLAVLAAGVDQHVISVEPGLASAYRFTHELLREVLYNELSACARGQLHLRAGQALLSRRANGLSVSDVQLAHHLLAAQPFGDVEVAIAHAQKAANEPEPVATESTLRRALDMLLRSSPQYGAELAVGL